MTRVRRFAAEHLFVVYQVMQLRLFSPNEDLDDINTSVRDLSNQILFVVVILKFLAPDSGS